MKKREAGILLSISSLPSPYGIGCLSREAYDFVDQLVSAGQHVWQILPVGPTGYGDSPYQSFSAFAGNECFVDLRELIAEGLLTEAECAEALPDPADGRVDYGLQYIRRYPLLRLAFSRLNGMSREQERFEAEQSDWLEDYALFMAIKAARGGAALSDWEPELRRRSPSALAHAREAYAREIAFRKFIQFRFFTQWQALHEYAARRGIRIMGDMPIYISADSADVWTHPELFLLDDNGTPSAVAGCPPDGFSPEGQLWGNPLYRWDAHEAEGYAWWRRRFAYAFSLFDSVRIDHFRGFDAYYAVPYGASNAVHGRWEKGPGKSFFFGLGHVLDGHEVVAEDLGNITDSVRELLRDSGLEGMKILQFAFDPAEGDFDDNPHVPDRYEENCIAYTGTHDNPTLVSWMDSLDRKTREQLTEWLGEEKENLSFLLIRRLLKSAARLCIIPMQDYLELDDSSRMNRPATLGENWRWRLRGDDFSSALQRRIACLMSDCGR